MDFKLTLVDPNRELIDQWMKQFASYEVTIHHGKFEEIENFDCLINAGNSFGLMDGGVDYAISEFFGWDLQKEVQKSIQAFYFGEQPVGTSLIVLTGTNKHPYIAHTPTMRIPVLINDTQNVYQAFRAALVEILKHKRKFHQIRSVVCTGLGTGCGQMEPSEAARQMAMAYKNVLEAPSEITWQYAERIQSQLLKKS